MISNCFDSSNAEFIAYLWSIDTTSHYVDLFGTVTKRWKAVQFVVSELDIQLGLLETDGKHFDIQHTGRMQCFQHGLGQIFVEHCE